MASLTVKKNKCGQDTPKQPEQVRLNMPDQEQVGQGRFSKMWHVHKRQEEKRNRISILFPIGFILNQKICKNCIF